MPRRSESPSRRCPAKADRAPHRPTVEWTRFPTLEEVPRLVRSWVADRSPESFLGPVLPRVAHSLSHAQARDFPPDLWQFPSPRRRSHAEGRGITPPDSVIRRRRGVARHAQGNPRVRHLGLASVSVAASPRLRTLNQPSCSALIGTDRHRDHGHARVRRMDRQCRDRPRHRADLWRA